MNRAQLKPTPRETVALQVEVWPLMRLARLAVGEIRTNAAQAGRLRGQPRYAETHRLAVVELHTAAREMAPVIRAALQVGWNPAQFRRLPAGGVR